MSLDKTGLIIKSIGGLYTVEEYSGKKAAVHAWATR